MYLNMLYVWVFAVIDEKIFNCTENVIRVPLYSEPGCLPQSKLMYRIY